MIIRSKTPLKCEDCGDVATPEDMRTDKVRMHKTRDGQILCECCYEDYLEKYVYNDDEY